MPIGNRGISWGQHIFLTPSKIVCLLQSKSEISKMMIWIFIFSFLLTVSATTLETQNYPPGCNNCERKLSPFCCAVAWNGICCEYPMATTLLTNQVNKNTHSFISFLWPPHLHFCTTFYIFPRLPKNAKNQPKFFFGVAYLYCPFFRRNIKEKLVTLVVYGSCV